jgi:hypothetical protein
MEEALPGLLQETRYLRQLCDRIVAASPVAAAGGSSGSSAGGSGAASAAGAVLPSAAGSAGLPPLPPAYHPHAGGGGRSGFASSAAGPSTQAGSLTAGSGIGSASSAAAGGASSTGAAGGAGIGAGYGAQLASYSAQASAPPVASSASTGVGGGAATATGLSAAEAAAATGAEEGPTPEMLHDFLNAAYTDAAGVYKGDYQATGAGAASAAVADAAAAAVRAAGLAGAGSFGALTGSAGLQYQLPDGAPLRFGAGAAAFYPSSYGAAASALGLGQHPFQHAAAGAPGVSQMPSAADSGADAALAQLRDRVRATQQGAVGASSGLAAGGAAAPAPQ